MEGVGAPRGPASLLVINTSQPNAFMTAVWPQAYLDGRPARLAWGWNQVPLPPGRHHLRIEARQPRLTFGSADLVFDAHPGGRVTVYYAAPYRTQFVWSQPGAIGFAPVRSNGRDAIVRVRIIAAVVGLVLGLAATVVALILSQSH